MRWAGIGLLLAILLAAFATLKIQRDSARNDAAREHHRAEQLETAYLALAESTKKQNAAILELETATAAAQEKARQARIKATATGIKADARIYNLTNYPRQGDECADAKRLLLDYQKGRL
jgi:hypothetical protein